VQLVAGLAGLLAIASWRARRRVVGTVQRASSRPR